MAPRSVALITPHRAQRASLRRELAPWVSDGGAATRELPITMIDTVERLQGGEQETIVFSATASDPVAIAQNVEFILNLKRSNVAFSRPKRRLIVICSRTLLDHIPTDVQHYDAALLWKGLRALCSHELVRGVRDGVAWRLMVRAR
jgi:superfamily I DNA and/or RNA helicase